MNTRDYNEGLSDQQVCKLIKLYIRDDVNGEILSERYNLEKRQVYAILHNYGFNREHTKGKSNVRGIFARIFAKYNLTDKEIDDCIYRYMRDYRKKYEPEEVDYYLQEMLLNFGEQKELKQIEPSFTAQNTQQFGKIAVVVIVIVFLVRGCGFIGDKISGVADFFSNEYKFETFTYDGNMYAGNKKGKKPDGVCAVIPMRSNGTTYSLGEYEGNKIEGYGIICSSDIPLQSNSSENMSNYDEAQLKIRMGEMEESVLNGYGVVFDSSEGIVLGKYKNGKLKKYGCKVFLDENGSIASVEAVKGDKVKKQLKEGTYKGMTYFPEEGKIVIDEIEFIISAGLVSIKTEGVDIAIRDLYWTFDMFNAKTEEGIYIDYALGENIKCEVATNDSKGIRVNASEMPINYGNNE